MEAILSSSASSPSGHSNIGTGTQSHYGVLSPAMSLLCPPSASEHTPALHSLKFDKILFDANVHNKLVALGAIKGDGIYSSEAPQLPIATTMDTRHEEEEEEEEDIPGDPVNAFGIPQASLRCLEVHLRFFLPSHPARLTACCYSWHNI